MKLIYNILQFVKKYLSPKISCYPHDDLNDWVIEEFYHRPCPLSKEQSERVMRYVMLAYSFWIEDQEEVATNWLTLATYIATQTPMFTFKQFSQKIPTC